MTRQERGFKRQIPCDLTCKRNLINYIKLISNGTRGIESQNRLTAVRGEVGKGSVLKKVKGLFQEHI